MSTFNQKSSSSRSKFCCSFTISLVILGMVALGGSFAPASAAPTKASWQKLTPSELTAVWWQWAYSLPRTEHPLFDETGSNAYNGQPYSDLLFLGGTYGIQQLQNGDALGEVTRFITVKKNTTVGFPLINTEWDNICARPHLGGNCFGSDKFPANTSVPQLRALATANIDNTFDLYSKLTPTDQTFNTANYAAQNLSISRLQSPPFSYKLPKTDNLAQSFGVDVSGTIAPAVADGYYSYAALLAPGYYKLEFGGSLPIFDAEGNLTANKFSEAITYNITVIE